MQRIKETKKVWELDRIKNIAKDIMDDKEWVNDSHSKSEHKGIVDGLSRLINHMELAEKYEVFKKVSTRYELPDGSKQFGKAILNDPETFFTEDIMHKLNLAAEVEFKYGVSKNEDTIQDSDD